MKLSQVYLNAAQSVYNSEYCSSLDRRGGYGHWCCCLALSCALKSDRRQRGDAFSGFKKMFEPRPKTVYWFGWPCGLTKTENKKRKDHRVFALLFMRELAKDAKL